MRISRKSLEKLVYKLYKNHPSDFYSNLELVERTKSLPLKEFVEIYCPEEVADAMDFCYNEEDEGAEFTKQIAQEFINDSRMLRLKEGGLSDNVIAKAVGIEGPVEEKQMLNEADLPKHTKPLVGERYRAYQKRMGKYGIDATESARLWQRWKLIS